MFSTDALTLVQAWTPEGAEYVYESRLSMWELLAIYTPPEWL